VADIVGRPKHIYSIWRKMRRKGVDIDGIFDLMAVRVLVETEADCYTVLGFVHGEWRYIPGEFDDYITTPKANMYRSLHTAVIGPQGKPLEVQIRTREMDEHAERGVAAHWAYKENRGHDAEFQRRLLWMRHWLELKEEVLDDDQSGEDPQARETLGSFVQHFKDEFHPLHVYVLTPQGNVIELPHGSTPVDFAYAIHSDVGHRCRGAKVNGRIVPLTHHLESSTTVEILTAKKGGPSRDWLSPHLSYLKTARARNRVRQWFRQQDYDQHVQVGRHSLNREIERLGIEKHDLHEVLDKYNFNKVDDLLAAIGCGEISPVQVANNFVPRETRAEQRDEVKISHKGKEKSGKVKGKSGVVLEGVDDLMYSIARCCKPVPYDPIVGFITRGRGVTVHRQDCTVIKGLPENERNRLIEAAWSEQPDESIYSVDLHVIAGNRKGLLRDISSVFTNEDVDVLAVSSQTNKHEDIAEFRFVVEVKEMSQLSRVLAKIAQLPDILKAHRV
jgi:GTP pyrophosphokinase